MCGVPCAATCMRCCRVFSKELYTTERATVDEDAFVNVVCFLSTTPPRRRAPTNTSDTTNGAKTNTRTNHAL